MVLYKTKYEMKVDKISQKIAEIFNQRERDGTKANKRSLNKDSRRNWRKVQGLRITHKRGYKIVGFYKIEGPATLIEKLKESLKQI